MGRGNFNNYLKTFVWHTSSPRPTRHFIFWKNSYYPFTRNLKPIIRIFYFGKFTEHYFLITLLRLKWVWACIVYDFKKTMCNICIAWMLRTWNHMFFFLEIIRYEFAMQIYHLFAIKHLIRRALKRKGLFRNIIFWPCCFFFNLKLSKGKV